MKQKNIKRKQSAIHNRRFQDTGSGAAIFFSLFYVPIGFSHVIFAVVLFKKDLVDLGLIGKISLFTYLAVTLFFVSIKLKNLYKSIRSKEKKDNFLGTGLGFTVILPVGAYLFGVLFCIIIALIEPQIIE